MNDAAFVLMTLIVFAILAVLVGVLDRRLDDRQGGDR